LDFTGILDIYPTNTMVNKYDLIYLEVLNRPTFIIKTTNNPRSTKASNYTKASN
ncbi:hypothetical protein GE21DRAFT_1170345, partial [Neurospora crassa]